MIRIEFRTVSATKTIVASVWMRGCVLPVTGSGATQAAAVDAMLSSAQTHMTCQRLGKVGI